MVDISNRDKIDIVFISLIYRNYGDLTEFIRSVAEQVISNYKIIVVESYYNDDVSNKVRSICLLNDCDYLCVDNNGYGAGNNRGIEYAISRYDFKYVVICNPDVEIKSKIDISTFDKKSDCIAPRIITKLGKNQNPYWPYQNKLSEWLFYKGFKYDSRLIFYFGVGINKLLLLLYGLKKRKAKRTYSCHGSFFILKRNVVEEKKFRYDENMFLFYEEAYQAIFFNENSLRIDYYDGVLVKHKEDGSMNIANINQYKHLRESYLYYYEKYRKRNSKEKK